MYIFPNVQSLKDEIRQASEAEFSPSIDSAQALLEERQAILHLLEESRESLSTKIDDAYSKASQQEAQANIWRKQKTTFPSRLSEQLSVKSRAEENLPIKEFELSQALQEFEDAKELVIPEEHPDRSHDHLEAVRLYKHERTKIDKEIESLEIQTEEHFRRYQKESSTTKSLGEDANASNSARQVEMNNLRRLETNIKSLQLRLDSLQSKRNRLQDPEDAPAHRSAVMDYENRVTRKQTAIKQSESKLNQAKQALEDCKLRLYSADENLKVLRDEEGTWDDQIKHCIEAKEQHLRYAEAARYDLANDEKYQEQIRLVEEAKSDLKKIISERDSKTSAQLERLDKEPTICEGLADKLHFYTASREEINAAWRSACESVDQQLHEAWRSREQPIDQHIQSDKDRVKKLEGELESLKDQHEDLKKQLSEMYVTDELLHQFETTGDQVSTTYDRSGAFGCSAILTIPVTLFYYFGTKEIWKENSLFAFHKTEEYSEWKQSLLETTSLKEWEADAQLRDQWGDYSTQFGHLANTFYISTAVLFFLLGAAIYFSQYKQKHTIPRMEFVKRRRFLDRVKEIENSTTNLHSKLDTARSSLKENEEKREAAVGKNRKLAGDSLDSYSGLELLPETDRWDHALQNLHEALFEKFAKGSSVAIPSFSPSNVAPLNPAPNDENCCKAWKEFEQRLVSLSSQTSTPVPDSSAKQ